MTAANRLVALDILRGVAVLGITVANLPGFALPQAAYFSPLAAGGAAPADLTAWALTFVLVEGKMRGLFAALFGASLLLVVERADASGQNGAAVHLRRMGVLYLIGAAHLYLLWYGDILHHYALVGVAALLFVHAPTRLLLLAAAAALLVATIGGVGLVSAAVAPATRAAVEQSFGRPPAALLLSEIAALRGSLADGLRWRWRHDAGPVAGLFANGPETLGYMLLGMAAYRAGFATGAWPRARYVLVAALTLPLGTAIEATLATRTAAHGFAVPAVVTASFALGPLVHAPMVGGYAALLLASLPGTRAGERLAALGRTALSNYLLSSLVLAAIFYGWGGGRFAHWGRGEAYLLLPPLWMLLLSWPPAWLARYQYGPAEWLWRTLARGSLQPWRRVM
ncbi:DUF418 domain-containing protein [Sphingomonas yunnanensis]|uniref:DUF418 domain-containing protein n=1 Tax=Sphingomonas yunnanensis TaxID=310400 RepID=UPI001CA684F2|nr:DUF418 domain-containing protein [Sphingomonas yunnanensis]MBY9061671.1 DUF418 domain-containing protein [Sphingomonas yunnanensis]